MSIAEAARISGRSDKTIRRWIKAGRLRAIKSEGSYAISLDDVSSLIGTMSIPTSTQTSTPELDSDQEDVHPSDVTGTGIMRAEAMAAYTRSMLEPLVQTIERQAETIADLREERGRQGAELERAASAIVTLNAALEARIAAESTPAPAEPPVPRGRVLTSWWLAVLGMAVVVALLAWPR